MKERTLEDLLANDKIDYGGLRVVDYNDYGNLVEKNPTYRGVQRSRLSQDSAEEPFQENILDENFSSSSFFGILTGANRKQTQSYVKIVNFDDLKSETETYLRKDYINQLYTNCYINGSYNMN